MRLNDIKNNILFYNFIIYLFKVENEYGSYGTQTSNCDKKYLTDLRDLILEVNYNSFLIWGYIITVVDDNVCNTKAQNLVN